jgi:hypothetical protein
MDAYNERALKANTKLKNHIIQSQIYQFSSKKFTTEKWNYQKYGTIGFDTKESINGMTFTETGDSSQDCLADQLIVQTYPELIEEEEEKELLQLNCK